MENTESKPIMSAQPIIEIPHGPVSMDEAFRLAGGHGKYQKLAAATAVITFMCCMLYVFSIPFFIATPELECKIGDRWYKCDVKDICEHRKEQVFRYKNKHQNFISEYDLLCDEEKQSTIPFVYFIGVVISCTFFSTFGDVYGRLPLLIMGQVGNIIGLAILGIFSSYNICLITSGLIGFLMGINQATPFNFIYDSMESKYSTVHASLLNACWASGEIIIALIMYNNTPWRIMVSVIICFAIIFTILLCYIIEPPRFHYSKGNLDKALSGIKHIAEINGVELPPNLELDKEALKLEQDNEVSILKVLKSLCCVPTLLFRTILICVAFFFSMTIYYGISVNLEKFVGDMVVNGVCNAVAEIVGVIAGGVLISRLGKRPTLMLMYLTAAVGLFSEGWFETNPTIACISMYIAKAGSAGGDNLLYVFAGEIFPTAVKNVALAIGMVSCSVGSMIAPIIGLLPYFTMFCVLSATGIINSGITWLYPVKAKAESLDTVEQLKN